MASLSARLAAALLLPAVALAAAGPGQRSLAVTANGATEMAVTWASLIAWTKESTANVTWWPSASPQATASAASWRTQTYSAGFGWTGTLFAATMTGLVPGAEYSYFVTDATGNASETASFHAAPAPAADAAVRIGVLADMGTIELMGWDVAALVIREHKAQAFDAFFISGDLSYATVDPPNNEFQNLWDAWVVQNEPFASTAPFMMSTGNHVRPRACLAALPSRSAPAYASAPPSCGPRRSRRPAR